MGLPLDILAIAWDVTKASQTEFCLTYKLLLVGGQEISIRKIAKTYFEFKKVLALWTFKAFCQPWAEVLFQADVKVFYLYKSDK